MSLLDTLKAVSEKCLAGRPVPHSLAVLWKAHEEGDKFISDVARIEPFASIDLLAEAYGGGLNDPDEGIRANTRAMRKLEGRLGFFAQVDEESFLAFDFETGSLEDPPIVELDTEGQYDWKGGNLAEVIFRLAEDRQKADEARTWLAAHGMSLGKLGELGSTTQFFPNINQLRDRYNNEFLGQLETTLWPSSRPADPADLSTWLQRPGPEVRDAISRLLQLPPGETPSVYCAWCDADGLVTQIRFPKTEQTKNMPVLGIQFGMSEGDVTSKLGTPTATGKWKTSTWIAYALEQGRLRIGFKGSVVEEISLGLNK